MAFTITRKGKTFDQIMKDDMTKVFLEQSRAMLIGEEVKSVMIDKIESNTKRESDGSPKLSTAIELEMINSPMGKGWGVGNISTLNSVASDEKGRPYWVSINEGGYVPPTTSGSFKTEPYGPQRDGNGQRWSSNGGESKFFMTPKKTVEGMHYIEEGYSVFTNGFNSLKQ